VRKALGAKYAANFKTDCGESVEKGGIGSICDWIATYLEACGEKLMGYAI
jgi:hypothetical protein